LILGLGGARSRTTIANNHKAGLRLTLADSTIENLAIGGPNAVNLDRFPSLLHRTRQVFCAETHDQIELSVGKGQNSASNKALCMTTFCNRGVRRSASRLGATAPHAYWTTVQYPVLGVRRILDQKHFPDRRLHESDVKTRTCRRPRT
jgi:hypothetical protein